MPGHLRQHTSPVPARGHTGHLGEAADEVGVIAEAGQLAGGRDTLAGGKVAHGQGDALVNDIGADGKSRVLFELLAYIFAAVMKFLLQLGGVDRFEQMLLDVSHRPADKLRHEIMRQSGGGLLQSVDEYKQPGGIGIGQQILSVLLGVQAIDQLVRQSGIEGALVAGEPDQRVQPRGKGVEAGQQVRAAAG